MQNSGSRGGTTLSGFRGEPFGTPSTALRYAAAASPYVKAVGSVFVFATLTLLEDHLLQTRLLS